MMMRACRFCCLGGNKCRGVQRKVSVNTHMGSSPYIYVLRLETNLQWKREFTPLLIDPAALMDKGSIDDKKLPLLTHQ